MSISYYRQRPRFVLLLVCVPIIIVSLFLLHTQTTYSPWAEGSSWSSGDKGYDKSYDDGDVSEPAAGGAASASESGSGSWWGLVRPGTAPAAAENATGGLGVKKPKEDGTSSTGAHVPVRAIEKYMTDFLSSVWAKFDGGRHLEKYGLKIGNATLESYVDDLEAAYTKFFTRAGTEEYEWLGHALSRLSLHPPSKPYPEAPNQIVTTDKDPEHLPDMFGEWKKKMPGTNVVAFDDRALEEWVDDVFGGTELHAIWRRLPRIVLKSDIFRYLVLLVEGGIYADSDTAPLIPADQWGKPYEVRTPATLQTLTQALALANAPDDVDIWTHPLVNDGNELGEPALVIGVEFDAIMYGWKWREIGVSRAVQITQWVMMARPGHPVFLEVVGRALQKTLDIEAAEAEAKAKGEKYVEEWALEWTGPGVWTDCVYRYLLARYGFSPEDLIAIKKPIRVGDVLILPSKTFAAGWPDDNGHFRQEFDAVVHGFHGRWRQDDPGVQEINRVKEEEEKKKKEEEAKKAAEAAEAAEEAKKVAEEAEAEYKAQEEAKHEEEPAAAAQD